MTSRWADASALELANAIDDMVYSLDLDLSAYDRSLLAEIEERLWILEDLYK